MRARVEVVVRFRAPVEARAVARGLARAGGEGPAARVRGAAIHFATQDRDPGEVRARADAFLAAVARADASKGRP
jgi:hypothetical protein